MTLFRRIVLTVLVTTVTYVAIFLASFLAIRLALSLKDLSYQTQTILYEWNALDRAANDLLYRRIDSAEALKDRFREWRERRGKVDLALSRLRSNSMLKVLPRSAMDKLERVGFIWDFTEPRLADAETILSSVLEGEGHLDLGSATLLDGLSKLRSAPDSTYRARQPFVRFFAEIAVLDIVGDEIDGALAGLNGEIPQRVEDLIGMLLVCSIAGLAVASFLSIESARRAVEPLMDLSGAMARIRNKDFSVHLPPPVPGEIGVINEGVESMLETIHSLIAESLRKEGEKRDAEWRALQAQINPHFLFNTIGSLQMSAALRGDKVGAEGLKSLSRLLRNALGRGTGAHTLGQELGLLEDYLAVMQLRYDGRITFEVSVPDELRDISVPRLILQPIAENAIQHGLSDRLNRSRLPALLRVEAAVSGESLRVVVYDNGCGMSPARIASVLSGAGDGSEGHIGLANIEGRLRLLSAADPPLTIESDGVGFTRVSLFLPRSGTA